jgi:sugar phosphate isomerase/epimerase
MMASSNRRDFLKGSIATLTAAGMVTGGTRRKVSAQESSTPSASTGGERHPIRLGAPVYESQEDPEKYVLKARELGYRAIYCPGVSFSDTDKINEWKKAVRKHDVVIAEVGRWVNLMDADPKKREQNLATVTEGLALAEEIDARCCVDIAGSFSEETWYGPSPKNVSPEFFDLAVENARKIIDAVKPKRAKFSYEMMGWAIPDTADSYVKLYDAVDREGFGVHLDVCNAVNSPDKFWNNTDLIHECFDKLGDKMVSCHAKDLKWIPEMNIHFVEVPLGEGVIDYQAYLTRLAKLPKDVPLMIEHMKGEEEYARSREYLFEVGKKCDVAFE